MSSIVVCPACQGRVSIPDRMAGRTIPCPRCQQPLGPSYDPAQDAAPQLQFQDDNQPIIRTRHRIPRRSLWGRVIVGACVAGVFGATAYGIRTMTKDRAPDPNQLLSRDALPTSERTNERKPPEPKVQRPKPQAPAWEDVLREATKYSERIESIGRLEILRTLEAREEEQAIRLVSVGPAGREKAKQALAFIKQNGIEKTPEAIIEDGRKVFPETILRLQTPPNGFPPLTPSLWSVVQHFPIQQEAPSPTEIRSAAQKKSPKELMVQHMAFQNQEKSERPTLAELQRLQTVNLDWYCYSRAIASGRSNPVAVSVVKSWYANRVDGAASSPKTEGQKVAEAWACCGCLTDGQLTALQGAITSNKSLSGSEDFTTLIEKHTIDQGTPPSKKE